ncbi:MAG: hypothetical protein K9L21_03115 [Spirochaetia bacterium]|nr:hypothetical protein [Spirochaetia bacterium]
MIFEKRILLNVIKKQQLKSSHELSVFLQEVNKEIMEVVFAYELAESRKIIFRKSLQGNR